MAAATTEAQVCNLALALVGSRQFLDNLNESSVEAEICRRVFQPLRNKLLESWRWRFATKRAVLALTTEERTGWGYCYAMPTDCLKAHRIWDGNRNPGAGETVAWTKELNDASTGFLICTDLEEAELVYTAELGAVGLWPAHFVDALAASIAVSLAGALSVKPQMVQLMKENAAMELRKAAALDASEAVADPEPESEWIRERG